MNPFKYSSDNKRYHTLAYHNLTHGGKSKKAVIDAGLSCPNIDGSKGYGGCIFCDGGSGYFTASPEESVSRQIQCEVERIKVKTPDVAITGYFQAHTNTYCTAEKLDSMLNEAVSTGLLNAISVATRPDCIDESKVKIIEKYNEQIPVFVELGLQTVHDETAKLINRCYSFDTFRHSFEMLKNSGIRTCVHIINGLPGENKEMMLETAEKLGSMMPNGIKIHLLHVIKGTVLASMYNSGKYIPMTFDEYIDTVVSQLELIPAEVVIERITGDADKTKLLAPMWSKDKIKVLGTIDKTMAARNTWQGRLASCKKDISRV